MTNLKTIEAEKLEEIKNALIYKWVDSMSIDDLAEFYIANTRDFLNNLTVSEILESAENNGIKV